MNVDYHNRKTSLRAKILKNEEQRILLEQKLRQMSTVDSRVKRFQIQQIQSYFNKVYAESERAEKRNMSLLQDLNSAEQHLEQLRLNAEKLVHLKQDYQYYLQQNYPNWKLSTTLTEPSQQKQQFYNPYDRLAQEIKQNKLTTDQNNNNQLHQQQRLNNEGNIRQENTLDDVHYRSNRFPSRSQSYDVDSTMLFKRYEDQLKVGFDLTLSPPTLLDLRSPPVVAATNQQSPTITKPPSFNDTHDQINHLGDLSPDMEGAKLSEKQYRSNTQHQQHQDNSFSDHVTQSRESADTLSNSNHHRKGSLRMELNRSGLEFSLDFMQNELQNTLDQKKYYRHDTPTIMQRKKILNGANERNRAILAEYGPAAVSMVVLDQMTSTIRRYTIQKCLFTDEILSLNIKDVNKDIVFQRLNQIDPSGATLWNVLIEHFIFLQRRHVMNIPTIAKTFARTLISKTSEALEKAESLLIHILEKFVRDRTSSSSSDEENDNFKKSQPQPQQQQQQQYGQQVKNKNIKSKSWLDKIADGDDDDYNSTESSSSKSKPMKKSFETSEAGKRWLSNEKNVQPQEDSDMEFYS
ncbi:unnamed protein product [Didymodactylos carnosus]|uniref:Centrosomal protein kizuna n=1 Tax=Didymodactylos carnosus TaxID=1234261 RepID=A0A814ANA3_9BILA|nr:unnamed protein product [Didymodactylos carnosus]CAF0917821.1 unnamed protein product [Didymodactylos carnosus]CAF3543434.1 unnamed protein product [Didymodactylos carnosus]CAF3697704.1 unnamed protein product [Didymodactylos carnosus]